MEIASLVGKEVQRATEQQSRAAQRKSGQRLSGWLAIFFALLLGLAVLAFFLFSPGWMALASQLPVALHSPLRANYAADPIAFSLAPVESRLIQEVLRDLESKPGSSSGGQIATLVIDLLTPVPTITPDGSVTSLPIGTPAVTRTTSPDTPNTPQPALPTPSPTVTLARTATSTASPSPTHTVQPTALKTITPTVTLTQTTTAPVVISPTRTVTRTPVPTLTTTLVPSRTPTPSPPAPSATPRIPPTYTPELPTEDPYPPPPPPPVDPPPYPYPTP